MIQLYNVKMSIELVWCCHSKIEIESIRGIKCFKIHKFRIIRTKAIDSDNDNSTKSSGQNSDSVVFIISVVVFISMFFILSSCSYYDNGEKLYVFPCFYLHPIIQFIASTDKYLHDIPFICFV